MRGLGVAGLSASPVTGDHGVGSVCTRLPDATPVLTSPSDGFEPSLSSALGPVCAIPGQPVSLAVILPNFLCMSSPIFCARYLTRYTQLAVPLVWPITRASNRKASAYRRPTNDPQCCPRTMRASWLLGCGLTRDSLA